MSRAIDGQMRIRAVTFDVGGTLLVPWPSVGSVYARVAESLGVPAGTAAELDAAFATAWRRHSPFPHTRVAWRGLVGELFPSGTGPGDMDRLFEALWTAFSNRKAWRVLEGVEQGIRDCRAHGIRLGVVSNWDERLPGLLRQFPWGDAFEFVLASGVHGRPKPSPDLFLEAARRFRLEPGEILHVGDRWLEDVEGARRAGLRSVQVGDRDGDSGAGGDWDRVKTLAELARVLGVG